MTAAIPQPGAMSDENPTGQATSCWPMPPEGEGSGGTADTEATGTRATGTVHDPQDPAVDAAGLAPATAEPGAAAQVVDDRPVLPARSTDEEDLGWGDPDHRNDERLLRDVPPHW